MGRADRVHNKTSAKRIQVKSGIVQHGNVSTIGSGDPNAIGSVRKKQNQGMLPVAHAQLQDTSPTVNPNTDIQYQPENTANVALERNEADYSSDHSIERFLTNIGRGAYDTGESYSTDIIGSATGNAPVRHMRDSTLMDTFITGGLEGRLHDSLAEAGRRVVEEPGRVIGEVAVETAFLVGTMGVGVAAKGVRAGAMSAKVLHTNPITGKAITGFQRTKSGFLRKSQETKFIGDKTTTYIKTDKKGKVTVKTESNKPTLFDPLRPLSRKIEKGAQPVGEQLRKGVSKITGGRRGQEKTPTYDAFDPFNEPAAKLSYLVVPGAIGGRTVVKAAASVGGGWDYDPVKNVYTKDGKTVQSKSLPKPSVVETVVGSGGKGTSTKKQTKKPSSAFSSTSIPLGSDQFVSQLQFTPEKITELKPNQVMVYGANDAGPGGAYLNWGGAAGAAAKLGAGKTGQPGIVKGTLGVVTKAAPNNQPGSFYSSTPEGRIKVGSNIRELAKVVKDNPDKEFLFTGFGTERAGFKANDIVNMFEGDDILQSNIVLPKVFYNQLSDTQKARYLAQKSPTSKNRAKRSRGVFTASSIPLGSADIIPMAFGDGVTPPVGLDPVTGLFIGRNTPGAGEVKGYVDLPNLQSSTIKSTVENEMTFWNRKPAGPTERISEVITDSVSSTPSPLNPTYPGAPKSFVSEVDKITDEQITEQMRQIIPSWGGDSNSFNAAQFVANQPQKNKLIDEAINRVKKNKNIKPDNIIETVAKSKSNTASEAGYDVKPVDSFAASEEKFSLASVLEPGGIAQLDPVQQVIAKADFEKTHGSPQPYSQDVVQAKIRQLWEERISQGVPIKDIRKEENEMIKYYEGLNADKRIVKENNPEKTILQDSGVGTEANYWGIDARTNIAETIVPQKVQPNVKENPMFGQAIRQEYDAFELPTGNSQMAPGTITPYRGVDILGMGAQTGVDQGAGNVGTELGIKVVGNVPRGFKTESGPLDESLRMSWDLKESVSGNYPARTRLNIGQSDATVVFYPTLDAEGKAIGPGKGTSLTIEQTIAQGKPLLINPPSSDVLNKFLVQYNVKKLNVGGTRGSDIPEGTDFISNMQDILRGMTINTGKKKNISQIMSSRGFSLADGVTQTNQQALVVEGTILGYGGGRRTKTGIKQLGKEKQRLGDDTTRDQGALSDQDPIISGISTRLSNVDAESVLAAGRLEFDQPLVGGISELEQANPGITRAVERAWLKEEKRVAALSKEQGKTVKPKMSEISKTIKNDGNFGIVVPVKQIKEIKRIKDVRKARTNYKSYRNKLTNFLDDKPQGRGKQVRSDVNIIEGIGPGFLNFGGLSVPVLRQGVRQAKPTALEKSIANRLPPTLDEYAKRHNMTWKDVESTLFLNKDKYTDPVQRSAFNRGEVPEPKVVVPSFVPTITGQPFRAGFLSPTIRKGTKRAKDIPYTGKEKKESLFTKDNFAEVVGQPYLGEKGYSKNLDIERATGARDILVTRTFDFIRPTIPDIIPKPSRQLPKGTGKKLKQKAKEQKKQRQLDQAKRITRYRGGQELLDNKGKGKGKGKGKKKGRSTEDGDEVEKAYANFFRQIKGNNPKSKPSSFFSSWM